MTHYCVRYVLHLEFGFRHRTNFTLNTNLPTLTVTITRKF